MHSEARPVSAETKRCSRCEIAKPVDQFGTTRAKGKTYRRAQCNECRAEVRRGQPVDNARQRELRATPEAKAKMRRRQRRQRDDIKAKEAAGRIRYRERNPERVRGTQRLSRYGITMEQFDQLAEQQGWQCAICQANCTAETFNVDHDHDTQQVRGLLCNHCNRGLGCFKDNTAALLKAADYLLATREAVPTNA